MCFPLRSSPLLSQMHKENEVLPMTPLLKPFCLPHRCRITSGKSVRATCLCAATAANAARTRAVVSAASSEDSCNSHTLLIYYFLSGLASRNNLFFTSSFIYTIFISTDSTLEELSFTLFIFILYISTFETFCNILSGLYIF